MTDTREDKIEEPGLSRAPVMRSRFCIEVAAEIVAADDQPYRRARAQLRDKATDDGWALNFFASSTIEGIDAVASGEATLAIVNPAAILTMAVRGTGPFKEPLPLRVITTFPSPDSCAFAAKKELGLASVDDILARKAPLKLSVRAEKDHCLHGVLDDIFAALGMTTKDLTSWGGGLRHDASPRWAKKASIEKGANAVFEEATRSWIDEALELGMDVLPFSDALLEKLEAVGYRRKLVRKADHPGLPRDVPSIDFSGWAVFVRADTPDRLVGQICAAVEARKNLIPWQGPGPLPVERMCKDTPDTPMDVPLHPAAENYWKSRGFI